jgi:tellurite resistance protein TerC
LDYSILIIILQLIFLEGLLSIDNAAVLGTLVVKLPKDQPVPWPAGLQKFGNSLQRVLGNQRAAALRVGILGAYIGRGLMLLAASFIIRNPWLNVVGALYLIHLAFENLGMSNEGEGGDEIRAMKQESFWAVVVSVELADLAFSLDNVVAAVALSNKLWVVMAGVFIGILAMRFAAGWFSVMVEKEPVLKPAAYILILAIAIELLLQHFAGFEITDLERFVITVSIILFSLAYTHFKPLRKLRFILVWLAHGFSSFNILMDWALAPFFGLIRLIVNGGKKIFTHPDPGSLREGNPLDPEYPVFGEGRGFCTPEGGGED